MKHLKIDVLTLFPEFFESPFSVSMMKRALDGKGIPVDERTLYIPGSFAFMNKGRPNEEDLAKAADWAKSIIKE